MPQPSHWKLSAEVAIIITFSAPARFKRTGSVQKLSTGAANFCRCDNGCQAGGRAPEHADPRDGVHRADRSNISTCPKGKRLVRARELASGYWRGIAGAAKGSGGANGSKTCQIASAAELVPNERPPVVPNSEGIAVA
jgi:hypothetical protein